MYSTEDARNDGGASKLAISAPLILSPGCGCEPACFRQVGGEEDHAACNICGEEVTVSLDVARYLEEGERIVWVNGTDHEGHDRGLVLAYFTESVEEPE